MKKYLEKVPNVGIIVNHFANIGDELHNPLCLPVGGKSFPSKEADSGNIFGLPFLRTEFLHLLITINDPKNVQELSFVLVDALHLRDAAS